MAFVVMAYFFLGSFLSSRGGVNCSFVSCFSGPFLCDHHGRHVKDYRTPGVRTGEGTTKKPFLGRLFFLVKQEIPRTIVPVLLSLFIMALGWLTPLGPVFAIFSTILAVIFLAWDNTDLVPARRLYPFKTRFKLLFKTLPFHFGFGLLFLIPIANILFLSFAPVGATLYYIKKHG